MSEEVSAIGWPSCSASTAVLAESLGKAQMEFKVAGFDSSNPHFRSQYASYQACCLAVRDALVKHGMALPDFRPGVMPNGEWAMIGTLRHKSGQYITGMAPLFMGKKDMQQFGAACTYAKRTLLMALTGAFAGEPDDDGNSVSEPPPTVSKAMAVAKEMDEELSYEQAAKEAIMNAETQEEAAKFLAKVKLRVKNKAITPACYKRCEVAFKQKWEESEGE